MAAVTADIARRAVGARPWPDPRDLHPGPLAPDGVVRAYAGMASGRRHSATPHWGGAVEFAAGLIGALHARQTPPRTCGQIADGRQWIARLAVGEAPSLRRGIAGPDPLAVYRTLPRSVELPLRSPLRTRDVSGKRRSIGAQGSADRGASVSRPVRIPPRALGRGCESTRRVQGCSPLRVKPRRQQESAVSGRDA